MLLSLLADISVLNGALLVEHNVALYLKRCSGSVGSIHMDHCICNAPQVKCYGDRPGEPLRRGGGDLSIRGVAEYSDFGPIERNISV